MRSHHKVTKNTRVPALLRRSAGEDTKERLGCPLGPRLGVGPVWWDLHFKFFLQLCHQRFALNIRDEGCLCRGDDSFF